MNMMPIRMLSCETDLGEIQRQVDLIDERNRDPRHAYLEWLRMEARLLQIELYPELDADDEYRPVGTFAKHFHFPIDKNWTDVAKPSTRAELVLRAVGIQTPSE